MQNIRLTIQYDGTRYLGWQRPAKDGRQRSVSYKLSEILQKTTGEATVLHAGAKTEPGVHALAQTVSFETDSSLTAREFQDILNQYLPMDIAVLDAAPAPSRFRADLSALSRTYEYRIRCSRIYDVFRMKYEAHLCPGPDIRAMEKAAGFLRGRHDFRVFSDARKKAATEKEISDIAFHTSGECLSILITADDFLNRMPRYMVSTLLEAGFHRFAPEEIPAFLEGRQPAGSIACKKQAGEFFSPKALLLKNIQY